MSFNFNYYHLLGAMAIGIVLAGCKAGPNDPGRVFMPDMFYSVALEPYATSPLDADSMSAREPVANTIPRGFTPYPYENSNDGYELAGKEWRMPAAFKNDHSLKAGKGLYVIYCEMCHGAKGEAGGFLVESGKFPAPPPAYSDRLPQITEGHMFHTVTYGRNLMGAHGSQLTPDERWQMIYYIQKLAGVGDFATEPTEEAASETETRAGSEASEAEPSDTTEGEGA